MSRTVTALACLVLPAMAAAQAPLPPIPAPLNVPKPGPQTDAPYAPQPILQGGIVIPLFPPDSPYLRKDKITIPEQYGMSTSAPGRINSIVHIHNPSIEVHLVDGGLNTGAAIILIAGGGHNTLNVGSESADFVPYFYNFGINTVILRSRLRSDGYNPQTDEVYDAQQAIRMVRAYAKNWKIDPNKIGVMGFSAGAELVAAAAVLYDDWDKRTATPPILSPEPPRVPISRASFIQGLRHSLAGAPRRRFRATCRRRSWSAPARTTRSTPSGRTIISAPCWRCASPMSKCTSTATGGIPAMPCRTAAT